MKTVQFNEHNLAMNQGIVRVYDCHPVTHEYVGFSDEFLAMGIGLPANSYLEEPPATKAGFAICRLDNQWQYVTDMRGKKAYNKETRAEVEIKELGELSDELTFMKPETEFDYWDGQNWITDNQKQNQATINNNESLKQSLLSQASNEIAILQDAVDLEIATDEELELLKQWKKYRVLLNRLDVNDLNVVFPEKPE